MGSGTRAALIAGTSGARRGSADLRDQDNLVLVRYLHTELPAEAAGYQPWALAIRGGGKDKRMEGPLRMAPVEPTVRAEGAKRRIVRLFPARTVLLIDETYHL
jgi:hypothetical protein